MFSLMEKNGNNNFLLEKVFPKVAIRDDYIYLYHKLKPKV